MDLQDKQIAFKFSIQQLILYIHLLFNWVSLLCPPCVIGQAIIFLSCGFFPVSMPRRPTAGPALADITAPIDSNGKIETRLPAEGSFANKFPSIHNHCGVMTSGSRKIAKIFIFDVFGETRPLTGNFSKFCSDVVYRDTDRRVVFEFREIWPTENR